VKILLVNHYAGSMTHGMEYRPYYLAREWMKMGHEVIVVAASFSHVRAKQPNLQTGGIEVIDGIKYYWLPTSSYKGNGVKRVINILYFIWGLYHLLPQIMEGVDKVIASSTHPFDVFPLSRYSKKFGADFIFELHDLWPLSLIQLGGMSRFHPFVLLVQIAEYAAYRRAKYVVSILPLIQEHAAKIGFQKTISVVPNGIVVDDWKSSKRKLTAHIESFIKKEKSKKNKIVCYAGAHGVANHLDTLIEAAAYLHKEKVHILLIGDGPEKGALVARSKQLKLSNITFMEPVPKAELVYLLDMVDIAYISLQKQDLFKYGISPNKIMDYMMAAKPVLAAVVAGNDLVRTSGCGLSVDPDNPEEIADAIKLLCDKSDKELKSMGSNGKKYVLKYHDYKVLAKNFIEAIGGSGR